MLYIYISYIYYMHSLLLDVLGGYPLVIVAKGPYGIDSVLMQWAASPGWRCVSTRSWAKWKSLKIK
jgi:hypothetical protein